MQRFSMGLGFVLVALVSTAASAGTSDRMEVLKWLVPLIGTHSLTGDVGCGDLRIVDEGATPYLTAEGSFLSRLSADDNEPRACKIAIGGRTMTCKFTSAIGYYGLTVAVDRVELRKDRAGLLKSVKLHHYEGPAFNILSLLRHGRKTLDCRR